MLNDIIIDKFRIFIDKDRRDMLFANYEEEYSKGKRIHPSFDRALEFYFPPKSFRTYTRYKYFFIEFNPSRFMPPPILSRHIPDDINLQMIPERILLNIFGYLNILTPTLISEFKVAEMHLTKNYVIPDEADYYLNKLMEIKTVTRNQFKPFYYKVNTGNSVYFSRLTRSNLDKEYTDNRIIKFYDKSSHLLSKTKPVIKLKEQPKLSQYEIGKLGAAYNAYDNTLDLSRVNLLRAELSYRPRSIKHIYNALDGKYNRNYLPFKTLLDHLKQNTLYSTLNELFLKDLKDNIFYADPENKPVSRGKSYTKALPLIKFGNNNADGCPDLYYIKSILNALNRKDVKDKAVTITEAHADDDHYKELYNLIFNTPLTEIDDNVSDYNYFCINDCKVPEFGYDLDVQIGLDNLNSQDISTLEDEDCEIDWDDIVED